MTRFTEASKWINGFFLRDVTLPHVIARTEIENGMPREAESGFFIAADTTESESENEKFVTEAMRDERLA